jgi:ABC-type glycerol-3-phosphate transport system substrate-binding protein
VPFNEQPVKLATIIATQDASWDTVYTYSKFMFQFGQRLLIPIADWYGDTSDFVQPALTVYTTPDGQLRGLPIHWDGYAWAWNKKIFKSAGLDPENPPDNWADLIAAQDKFKAAGYVGCVQPWLGSGGTFGDFYYKQMYNSFGVDFLSPDRTQVKFDGPEGLQTFQMIETGLKNGFFDPQTLNIADEHAAFLLWDKGNKYATLVIGTDSVPTLPKSDYGIKAMPGMKPGTTGTVNGSDGLGLSMFSSKLDAAKSFFQTMFSPEVAKLVALAKPELYPPTRQSILKDPDVLAANPLIPIFQGQAAGSEDLWSAPYDYSPVFDDVMHKLVAGTYDAAAAQKAAVKGVQDLIVKYLSQ